LTVVPTVEPLVAWTVAHWVEQLAALKAVLLVVRWAVRRVDLTVAYSADRLAAPSAEYWAEHWVALMAARMVVPSAGKWAAR